MTKERRSSPRLNRSNVDESSSSSKKRSLVQVNVEELTRTLCSEDLMSEDNMDNVDAIVFGLQFNLLFVFLDF
jgi:hypothetical protein